MSSSAKPWEDGTAYSKHNETEKLVQVQVAVDATTNTMRDNLKLVIERGEKLTDLEIKSKQLDDHAIIFANKSAAVRRKMCFKSIGMILLVLLFLVIVIVILYFAIK